MRNKIEKTERAAIGVLAGLILAIAGCPGTYEVDYVGPVPIEEEPPPPQQEEIPPLPYEDAVWVYGYWNWSGVRYVWVPGRYMRRPAPGYYWYPGGYVRRGNRYIYVHGRWGPRSYRPRHRYVHPRYYAPEGGGHYRRPPPRTHRAPPARDRRPWQ